MFVVTFRKTYCVDTTDPRIAINQARKNFRHEARKMMPVEVKIDGELKTTIHSW